MVTYISIEESGSLSMPNCTECGRKLFGLITKCKECQETSAAEVYMNEPTETDIRGH